MLVVGNDIDDNGNTFRYLNNLDVNIPVFSYQEDIMYEECRRIIDECKKNGTKVPDDVDSFSREIGQRKIKACEGANKYYKCY